MNSIGGGRWFGNSSEGCLIKQVFVLDLIKVFVLDLNFLVNFNEDFIEVFILDLN